MPVATTDALPSDNRSEFDASEDIIPAYEFPDAEGAATTDGFSSSDDGFQVVTEDFGSENWPSTDDGGYQVDFVDAPPRSWTSSSSKSSPELDVVCGENDFQITLPKGPLNEVKVLGMYFFFFFSYLKCLVMTACSQFYLFLPQAQRRFCLSLMLQPSVAMM